MKLLSYNLYKSMVFLLSASLGHSANLSIYCGSLTNYTSTKLENPLPLLTNTCFDENRNSVVYAHGLNQSPEDPTAQKILARFIALLYNVFAIDWSKEASTGIVLLTPLLYPATVVPNALKVGKICGDALNIMSNYKLNINTTKCVGLSLGAQVLGRCGKQLQTFNKHNIPKIDGLDPAGPGFEGRIALDGLDKTSGKCVIVHHTNPGVFGTFDQVGHKDIWYNCNKKYQPKCDGEPLNTRDKCSHLASSDYYAEAIVNPSNFAAVSSSSCSEWQSMDAATAAYIYINDDTDCTGDNGNFFLSTNGQSPYGKSSRGIYADNDPSLSLDNILNL